MNSEYEEDYDRSDEDFKSEDTLWEELDINFSRDMSALLEDLDAHQQHKMTQIELDFLFLDAAQNFLRTFNTFLKDEHEIDKVLQVRYENSISTKLLSRRFA